MVKRHKKDNVKSAVNQGQNQGHEKAAKIRSNKNYEYCSERFSPFVDRFQHHFSNSILTRFTLRQNAGKVRHISNPTPVFFFLNIYLHFYLLC
jgi:hypothetical protein